MTEDVSQQEDAIPPGAETLDPRYHTEMDSFGTMASEGGDGDSTEELAAARREAEAANDRYLRARADMENFKKRMERTYADSARNAKKVLLSRLLGVKDNLDRALQYGGGTTAGEGIMEGVRLTQYQLDRILEQEGVKGISAEGRPFDPHRDEAIQSVDDPSVPDHTVVQVVRAGYTYEDEVLRPAQVIVSVHGESD